MKKYPKYIKIDNDIYGINTDFHVALECDTIARNTSISDYEKVLAIIYKLLGEKALKQENKINELYEKCEKYLQYGANDEIDDDDKIPSMDFEQDTGYIKASFMSDYQINLDDSNMHWYEFCDLMKGLSEECILNRVRYIREEDLSDKKGKELDKWVEMKKNVALKVQKTKEEEEADELFESQLKGV